MAMASYFKNRNVLFSICLFFLSATGFAETSDCPSYLHSELREPRVRWRELQRDAKVAVLVSQISALYNAGIVPTPMRLRDLSKEEAARVHWSPEDLQLMVVRANELFPDQLGRGYKHLVKLAGFRLKPRIVNMEVGVANTRPVPMSSANTLELTQDEFDRLPRADKVLLLKRQFRALVESGLFKTLNDLSLISQDDLDRAGLAMTTRSVRQLNRRAYENIPTRKVEGGPLLNGFMQLAIQNGFSLKRVLEWPSSSKNSSSTVGAALRERAGLQVWTPLVPFDNFERRAGWQEMAQRYRFESRAIVERLIAQGIATGFKRTDILELSALDLNDTGLTPDLVKTLPNRADLGFVRTGGYRALLREYGLKADSGPLDVEKPARTAVQPGNAGGNSSYGPTLTEDQRRLVSWFQLLQKNEMDLDLESLRSLSAEDLSHIGINCSGDELISQIRSAFSQGWREWVGASDGDADEIIQKGRKRRLGGS